MEMLHGICKSEIFFSFPSFFIITWVNGIPSCTLSEFSVQLMSCWCNRVFRYVNVCICLCVREGCVHDSVGFKFHSCEIVFVLTNGTYNSDLFWNNMVECNLCVSTGLTCCMQI